MVRSLLAPTLAVAMIASAGLALAGDQISHGYEGAGYYDGTVEHAGHAGHPGYDPSALDPYGYPAFGHHGHGPHAPHGVDLHNGLLFDHYGKKRAQAGYYPNQIDNYGLPNPVKGYAGCGGCRTCSTGQCQYRFYGQPDLFYNYYAWPSCSGLGAELYLSPRPVPPLVGHTYITYQPLMPHEFLYSHHRTYHRYYNGGQGLNRTSVIWYKPFWQH